MVSKDMVNDEALRGILAAPEDKANLAWAESEVRAKIRKHRREKGAWESADGAKSAAFHEGAIYALAYVLDVLAKL